MPGDDFRESAVFGLYVRVLSTFILLTTTIPRQAHAKRAKTRLQSEAKEA